MRLATSFLNRLKDALRILRWSPREQKTALIFAIFLASIPVLAKLPLKASIAQASTWTAIVLAALFLLLTLWRLWSSSLGPPVPDVQPEGTIIKGAGAFTQDDAKLFAQLGRLDEMRQLYSDIHDQSVPLIVVMGESGVGKTSLLRAGLAFVLGEPDRPVSWAYWEASARNSHENLLRAIEIQLGTPDLKSIGSAVVVVDQLEQLDPQRNEAIFSILRDHLKSPPPFTMTWVVAFRREYAATWFDFLISLPEECGHRSRMLSVSRFTVAEGKKVLASLAEHASLHIRASLVDELLTQIAEDGRISPVDLGITLQVLHQNPSLAYNPATLRSSGGHAGLLTSYLDWILDPYSRQLKDEVLRAMLSLIDAEEDQRIVEGKHLSEIIEVVAPENPKRFKLALETLAQPAVRVLELDPKRPRQYRLIHERFIPAIRRIAGELLGSADQASRLLDRRFRLWEHERRHRRYLLHGRELRRVLRHRTELRWGKRREAKVEFINQSRKSQRLRQALAATIALLCMLGVTWALQVQRTRTVERALADWGFPSRTYAALPHVTSLTTPPVTNTIWLNRAQRLEALSIRLAPHYLPLKDEALPPSIQRLSIDLESVPGTELPNWPTSLKHLMLQFGIGKANLPTWPSSLERLVLVGPNPSHYGEARGALLLPELIDWEVPWPPNLKDLTLSFGQIALPKLPEWPPELEELKVGVGGLEDSKWPELPATLRSLSVRGQGAGVPSKWPRRLEYLSFIAKGETLAAIPHLPSSLRGLNVQVTGGVEHWPMLPAALQELAIDLRDEAATWPHLPPSIRSLTLDPTHSVVWGLPTIPGNLQQFTLTLVLAEHTANLTWLELPPGLEELTLDLTGPVSAWPRLPSSLRVLNLYLSDAKVATPPAWPSNLERLTLRLSGVQFEGFSRWPTSIQELSLDFPDGEITGLPPWPESLKVFNLSMGRAEVVLPEWPAGVKELSLILNDAKGALRNKCFT